MSAPDRNRSQAIPARRPYLRSELHSKLAPLSDQVANLWDGAHPLEYEEVADGLYTVFRTASNLAPEKSYTGCAEHPNGAQDPEAPEGWGLCLICNDRRRRGAGALSTAHTHAVPPAAPQRRGGYPVPEPPFTLQRLVECMRELNELAFSLELTSPTSAYATVADRLHEAFCVARELARPRNVSGCAKHPGAPLDPDAPPGEECLFCAGEKRRKALAGNPVTLPPVRRGERRNTYRRFPRPVDPGP